MRIRHSRLVLGLLRKQKHLPLDQNKLQERREQMNNETLKKREILEKAELQFVEKKEEKEYLGISVFNNPTTITIIDKLGISQAINQINQTMNLTNFYNIYLATFGASENRKVFVLTKAEEKLALGENDLYLKPIETKKGKLELLEEIPPEKQVLDAMCKNLKIPITEGSREDKRFLTDKELVEKIKQKNNSGLEQSCVFTIVTGIDEKEIKKLSNEQWEKAVKDFICEGIEKSYIIELTYKSDLIRPVPNTILPRKYQPFNSNELVFTNPKSFKTSTSNKTSETVDSATPANLLGFSTAKEKVEGSLNNQTKTLSIDEVQDTTKDDEAFKALSTYLELGETEVRKGKAIVKVRGYAGIRLQGNPKLMEEENEIDLEEQKNITEYSTKKMFQEFSDTLTLISKNHKAFGSRISWIVFREDMEKADELVLYQAFTEETIEKNEKIVTTVLEKARKNYTGLYKNQEILNWLRKDVSKEYQAFLDQAISKALLVSLRDFLKGHKDATRHIRGKALKLSCVDFALDLANGKIEVKKILEKAEEYLNEIEEQNKTSIKNLVHIAVDEESIKTNINTAFQRLPGHLKEILRALQKLNKDQTEIDLEELKNNFSDRKESNISSKHIITRTTNSLSKTNYKLQNFKVVIERNGIDFLIKIKEKGILELIEVDKSE